MNEYALARPAAGVGRWWHRLRLRPRSSEVIEGGFRVEGLGLRGLGFRVWVSGFKVEGLGLRVENLGFRGLRYCNMIISPGLY